MACAVRALAVRLDYQSSVPETHMVERPDLTLRCCPLTSAWAPSYMCIIHKCNFLKYEGRGDAGETAQEEVRAHSTLAED